MSGKRKADGKSSGFKMPKCSKRTADGRCLAIGCCEIGDMFCECSAECAALERKGCKCRKGVGEDK